MNTKTLSPRALSIIDQYLHFKAGSAVCSVPYFNNKTVKARASLRSLIGKGSPKEISDEVSALLIKNHVAADSLADESLKKLLVDSNIGIDCSAFAYYILNAENGELGKGSLDKHIAFVKCTGMVGKIRCALRPIENCDVATLADDRNSRAIPWQEIAPGDLITMIGIADPAVSARAADRDHVLVVHQVEYQNFVPLRIHYSHAVAYPEDGVYGSGIRQGMIETMAADQPLMGQEWIEAGMRGQQNRIFATAQRSETKLKRLNWF